MKISALSASLLASCVLLFSNCSKDDDAPSAAGGNYSPATAGSNWTYSITQGTAPAVSYKLTATNNDSVANGKSYKVYTSSDGSHSYMLKSDHDYYRLISYPTLGINNIEELYLKDNAAVNDKWTSNVTIQYMGFPLNGTLTYTLAGRGESRTVSGKTYDNNVIHVRMDVTAAGVTGGGDFYYADGVGMIENNILITPAIGSAFASKQVLTAYEIK